MSKPGLAIFAGGFVALSSVVAFAQTTSQTLAYQLTGGSENLSHTFSIPFHGVDAQGYALSCFYRADQLMIAVTDGLGAPPPDKNEARDHVTVRARVHFDFQQTHESLDIVDGRGGACTASGDAVVKSGRTVKVARFAMNLPRGCDLHLQRDDHALNANMACDGIDSLTSAGRYEKARLALQADCNLESF